MKSETSAWLGIAGVGACLWLCVLAKHNALSQQTHIIPPDSSTVVAAEKVPGSVEEPRLDTTLSETEPAPPNAPKTPVEKPKCINVNTGDEERLAELPGIGPVIAGRIITYRTDNGNFSKPDDLRAVKGIGPAKVNKVKDLICF
ncbi:MAG: hypothetical protein GF344_06080 [Chitinivibrionales bacterium]|nr:hypothetical protein [Chitinivibrionales bacterium]MBD3356509.1 hypothetical protein [Chitinivibrionales bacterium]